MQSQLPLSAFLCEYLAKRSLDLPKEGKTPGRESMSKCPCTEWSPSCFKHRCSQVQQSRPLSRDLMLISCSTRSTQKRPRTRPLIPSQTTRATRIFVDFQIYSLCPRPSFSRTSLIRLQSTEVSRPRHRFTPLVGVEDLRGEASKVLL